MGIIQANGDISAGYILKMEQFNVAVLGFFNLGLYQNQIRWNINSASGAGLIPEEPELFQNRKEKWLLESQHTNE